MSSGGASEGGVLTLILGMPTMVLLGSLSAHSGVEWGTWYGYGMAAFYGVSALTILVVKALK